MSRLDTRASENYRSLDDDTQRRSAAQTVRNAMHVESIVSGALQVPLLSDTQLLDHDAHDDERRETNRMRGEEVAAAAASSPATSSTATSTSSSSSSASIDGSESVVSAMSVMMSSMLSYLDIEERRDCSLLSRSWSHHVKRPSSWLDWEYDFNQSIPTSWHKCFSYFHFDQRNFTSTLEEMKHMRGIRMTHVKDNSTQLTLRDMRSQLQKLKLEELLLHDVRANDVWSTIFMREESSWGRVIPSTVIQWWRETNRPQDSIVGLVPQSHDPAIWSWSSTLKHISIGHSSIIDSSISLETSLESMFTTLSQRVWHRLESFTWHCSGKLMTLATLNAFAAFINVRCLPSLTSLSIEWLDAMTVDRQAISKTHTFVHNAIRRICKAHLPHLKKFTGRFRSRDVPLGCCATIQWTTLTSLNVDFMTNHVLLPGIFTHLKQLHIKRFLYGPTRFFSEGLRVMYQLESLTLPLSFTGDDSGISDADSHLIRRSMIDMKSLTQLTVQFRQWCHVTSFSWVNQIDALPSLTHLELDRLPGCLFVGESIPIVLDLPLTIARIMTLKVFMLQRDILSIHHLRQLTESWSKRSSTCQIEKFDIHVNVEQSDLRHDSLKEEEESMCAIVKDLAHLPHLTQVKFMRTVTPSESLAASTQLQTLRKPLFSPHLSTSDDAMISRSYLPLLRHLQYLTDIAIADEVYAITPHLLNEWTRTSNNNTSNNLVKHDISSSSSSSVIGLDMSDVISTNIESPNVLSPLSHLRSLYLVYSFDSSVATVEMLIRFPQLERVALLTLDESITSAPKAIKFSKEVATLIKQRNEQQKEKRPIHVHVLQHTMRHLLQRAQSRR